MLAGVVCLGWNALGMTALLEDAPTGSAVLLYLAGTGLQVLAISSVSSAAITPHWGALPLALATVPVLYALRGLGLPGLLGSLLCPLPGMWLLLSCRCTAGAAVLLAAFLFLLLALAAADWFELGSGFTLVTVLTTPAAILSLGLLFGGWDDVLARGLVLRFRPGLDPWGKGYADFLSRQILEKAAAVGSGSALPPSLSGFVPFHATKDPYLLSRTLFTRGWLAGFLIVLLALGLCAAAFALCRRRRGISLFLALGMTAALAAQTLLFLAQNLGFHLAYTASLPFLSGGTVNTALSLITAAFLLTEDKRADPN